MQRAGWVVSLAALLFVSQAMADEKQGAEAAVNKAQRLEQSVAEEGSEQPEVTITRPEAQAVDPEGEAPLDDALTCLARTIYWEARGQGAAEMEAIANVVMNRLGHEAFPETVCDVVRQGSEVGECQFSWWCDGRPDSAEEEEAYAAAKEIARRALNQELPDRTEGALYFHDRTVAPSWAREYRRTAESGAFLFYKPPEDLAE